MIRDWEEREIGRQEWGLIQAQLFADRGHACPLCGQINIKVSGFEVIIISRLWTSHDFSLGDMS